MSFSLRSVDEERNAIVLRGSPSANEADLVAGRIVRRLVQKGADQE